MPNMINLIFIFGAKYLYLLVLAIALVWFLMQSRPRQKETLMLAGICLPLILVIFKLAGHLYYNPRPFVVGHFKPLIYHNASNGFPSHHALIVTAAVSLVFIFNRRLGFVLWILALGVGLFRVYVGVHHLVDIAASILISIGSVALVCWCKKYLRRRKEKYFSKGG